VQLARGLRQYGDRLIVRLRVSDKTDSGIDVVVEQIR